MRKSITQALRRAAWGLEDRFRVRLVHIAGTRSPDDYYADLSYKSNVRALIKSRGINVVIDVGANTGQFALALRAVGYGGRIVSFEPAARPLETLTRLASGDLAWSVRRTALGRTTSELRMNTSHLSNFNSFRAPVEKYSSLFESAPGRESGQEVVPVARLDDVWAESVEGIDDPRCFLKVDTQGFDSEVIAGGTSVALPRCLAVQFEASVEPIYEGTPPWYELIEEVRRAGFKLSGLFPCARGEDREVIEMDCLMIRA